MKTLSQYKGFTVSPLSHQLAVKYESDILPTWDQVPLTGKHTHQKLFAREKDGRQMFNKWDHSLIALDQHRLLAGFVISYERASENNNYYPQNSIYFNSFAVASEFQKQGLGKHLVQTWLSYNHKIGYLTLTGPLNFSVQTNAAPWNAHVQNLYTSLGFHQIATKTYPNRTDQVYFLTDPSENN